MHTQKPCSGGTIELNHNVFQVTLRSFNGLVSRYVYTTWFDSIVLPPYYMLMTSNLKGSL
jgi:hypothetical protein